MGLLKQEIYLFPPFRPLFVSWQPSLENLLLSPFGSILYNLILLPNKYLGLTVFHAKLKLAFVNILVQVLRRLTKWTSDMLPERTDI
jgi:hypothetical protein